MAASNLNNVTVTVADHSRVSEAQAIAERLALPFAAESNEPGLILRLTAERLELVQIGPDAPGPVYVDFVEGAMGHRRRFGGGRGQLVAKAVGVKKDKIPTVIDATAGLGRDAFVLAKLGCQVRMIERSSEVAELLSDGMHRAEQDDEVREIIARMSLLVVDASHYLTELAEAERPDVVYVDPMHPERTKAAVKKEMQLFRALVGGDEDDAALLQAALTAARKRVVVKRPRKSEAIPGPKPSLVYEGKSTRFDVYLIPA